VAKTIPYETVHKQLLRKPGVKAAFADLSNEFAIANAVISARVAGKLTQEQLAERMGTSQSFVARLESGKTKPTLRTLEKLATATATRVRFVFERA
jgi:ribosome-binding protein aMBF1 (putative translation factor)